VLLLTPQQFIAEHNRRMNKAVAGLHLEVVHLFLGCAWPGNMRELWNAIEGAVLLREVS
jgi:arginine utilization regulatory protein